MEIITTKRIDQSNVAREKYDFNNVWPYDSKTLYKVNNEIRIYHVSKFMAANIYGKSLPWSKFVVSG